MHLPSVSLPTFRKIAFATVAAYALLILTGGAVRLTGSGLGCPDWPTCYQHRLTAALKFHPMVEFGNRLVTDVVSILSIVVFVAALKLVNKRRDLVVVSGLILAGLAAQVVLGGLVVLFKLNPYLVALHFLLAIVVLGVALVLHRLTGLPPGRLHTTVRREIVWFSRLQLAVLGVLLCVGTIVSGAGPHSGSTGTKRIPIAFRDIAELHSTIALFLIGLSIGGLFLLRVSGTPARIQVAARALVEIYALQGAIGFTQYFLHDQAAVVEVHLAGATIAFIATLLFYLRLFERLPTPSPVGTQQSESGQDTAETSPESAVSAVPAG